MVSSFITFLPLLLVLNANAVIKEPGLRKFCSHQALDVPDGLKTTTRHKNDFCEQKLHYEATSEADAKATCRYFAPFETQLAERDGKTVKCQWKSRTTCENSQHTLINEVCFHLGYPGKAGDARARCLHGSTLHRVTDPEQSRWITFLLGSSDALHVANTAGDTSESMKYDNKTWVGSEFINETTTTQPRALQMRRNDLHDVPAGKIITVADFVELRVLCSKPAVEYQGPPSVTNTMHFPDHMRPPQVGGRAVLRTSNVYQAIATSETDIDTMVFHRICQNMCKKCFAALPDMTAELAKLGQMSLVASRYSPQGAPVRKNNECKKGIAISVLEDQFESQTPNGKVGGVEKSSWKSQYPDNMCADTPRVAVRAGTSGKLKDVPAISRHRLLCIIGSEPGVTARSFCRPESAIQKPDGSCECKPDFLDIIDIAGVANKERFVKGQVCIAKKPCDSITKTVAIVFQIDTRNEWKQVKKFMKSASKSLPS